MSDVTDSEVDVDITEPRGTKRKADEADLPPEGPRRIRALEQDVVNKIAAGEIIVAPMHALKELIENAVDAGSTQLEILVKDGGLKLLQITDNGHGIERVDMPILCERFTTSKLKAFEDLTSICTYGFRGEALASISHIAQLTVTTKTKESSCAWKASYADGKLVSPKPGQSAEPKATAGRGGTQITVEDLFYNVPTRRRAFRSASEEYAKILDVVSRYAVHCSGVAFTCKKHGDSSMGIAVASNATTVDRIRQIHGPAVSNELIEFNIGSDTWGFKASGWATSANYHVKRTMVLLFINHRAVESSAIKKAIEQNYTTFLPKGGHPFVYLDLEIEPQRVDVNVHPTKREVNFLNEDEIIEMICNEIREKLAKVDTSRTFMTQSLLPGVKVPTVNSETSTEEISAPGSGRIPKVPATPQRPYENNLVRTDSRMRKITSMLPPAITSTYSPFDETVYEQTDREIIQCRLASIKELRASVREAMHNGLTEVFAGHTYVGLVDERRRISAIQGGVKLFLVDYGMICNEYFYQVGLTDFGNFGVIKLDPPADLLELLKIAARVEEEEASVADIAEVDFEEVPIKVAQQLMERKDMLGEYFSINISEDGKVETIPLLLRGYIPSLAKLPRFLLRLGPYVDWTSEGGCFHTFLKELAAFYVPEPLPPPPAKKRSRGRDERDSSGDQETEGVAKEEDSTGEDDEVSKRRAYITWSLEHTLFPAFKARLVATKGLLNGVVEVANLKGLYRVFERC